LDIERKRLHLLLSGAQGRVSRSAFLETSLFVCLFLLQTTAIEAVKERGTENLLIHLFNSGLAKEGDEVQLRCRPHASA
jgi:hypothetical protein